MEEKEGRPLLPPGGVDSIDLDRLQKEVRGQCNRLIPEYQPLVVPVTYMDRQLVVIYAPAGEARPYQAPVASKGGERAYFIRQGSESVQAQGNALTQLLQMTAHIPFDDRKNFEATIDDLSPALVRNFLRDIKSDLVEVSKDLSDLELYRALQIIAPANGHEVPKNIGLLFFTNDPENIFPGEQIVIAQFGDDFGGDFIEEKTFRGPLHVQVRQALDYMNSLSTTMIRKLPGQAEAARAVAFPYEAMEEALVNAVFHRSYDGEYEPTKVMLYPNQVEITSYPGPMPGLRPEQFQEGNRVPRVPLRNRRIGDFLKELRLAEAWGTGIPKIRRRMRDNGSPEPQFEFGDTYFTVVLPAHPQYIVVHALREGAHLWAIGERKKALAHIKSAVQRVPQSGAPTAQFIEYTASIGEISEAQRHLQQFKTKELESADGHLPYLAMARVYLDVQDYRKAASVLEQARQPVRYDEIVEMAVLHKRAGDLESAHRLFADNVEWIKEDPKAVHEFAETKMKLAARLRKHRNGSTVQMRLYKEAAELLRRVIFLSRDDTRSAWAYFHLAQSLSRLRSPETAVMQALERAMSLLPHENKFREWMHSRKRDDA